jgi:hypothetical protein
MCEEEDWDIIPKPFPSRKFIPEWFKALPGKVNNENRLENSTIKRCMPFLDAMSVGWILPLAADVQISSSGDEGLSHVDYKWNFYKPIIENHSQEQISTKEKPNPLLPRPPIKFRNYWAIKAKPGWSVLFMPPLNRPDPRFTCMSGIVDCDGYFEFVNFPFTFNQPNFTGIIEAGTPLVQIIPLKRDMLPKEVPIRKFTIKDVSRLQQTRKKRSSHESHYKDVVWSKK